MDSSKSTQPKRRKVVFSSYDDVNNPFYGGGGARSIYKIVKRLSHHYNITIVTGNYSGAENNNNKITFIRIGPKFLGPKLSQVVYHILLPFYLRKLKFDVWVESFTPPFSTSFLPLFTKKPVVGLVHTLSAQEMERKYEIPFQIIENLGLKLYKTFIVLSQNYKQLIQKRNKSAKIYIIPNGVAPEYLSHSAQGNHILFLGRLEIEQKGIDLLLDAYRSIVDHTSVNLVIAGPGSLRENRFILKYIERYNLTSRVTITGRVSGENKEKLLSDSIFLVVPSRQESFSMVALEAMANGKPVVSFSIDGLDWIKKDCVLQASPFDAEELGQCMLTLIKNKKLRQKMGVKALAFSKNYSWSSSAEKYRKVLIHSMKPQYEIRCS
ncbi:MAG: glycosyltransferase family 4 protein [Patescibacteria group bacterium]|jgi:phosphatidylinositol alpha-mannosyltransferase